MLEPIIRNFDALNSAFEFIFRKSPNLMALTKLADGKIIDVNDSFLNKLGFSKEELIGKTTVEIGIFSSLQDRQRATEQIQKNGFIENFHLQIKAKDSTILQGVFYGHIMNIAGEAMFLSTMVDVTEFIKVEKSLRNSESKFRKLVETSNNWVWEINADNQFTFSNQLSKDFLGYLPEKLKGKIIFDYLSLKHTNRNVLHSYISQKKVFTNLVCEWLCYDGTITILECSGTPIIDQESNFCGYIGTGRDITTRTLLEQEIQESYFVLEQKVAERTIELSRANKQLEKEIEERKKKDLELTESEAKFRLAFENSNEAIVWADVETGTIIQCNHAVEKLFEYPKEELVGKNQSFLHPPEKIDYYKKLFYEKANYPDREIEAEVITASKKIKTVLISTSNTVVNGRTVIQGIFNDITRKKETELKLKESEERFRIFFEEAPDAIFIADPETGIILDTNKQAESLLKIPVSKIIGMHQTQLHPPEQRETTEKRFKERSMGKETGIPKENEVLCSDGRIIPVQVRAQLLTINGKKVVQGIFRDISNIKHIETILKESEEKFRQLAENIEEVFWVRTPTKMLYISPAYEKIFGKSCKSLYENPASFLDSIYEEDISKFSKENLLKTGYYDREFRIINPITNKIRWIWARSFPIKDENGKEIRTAGIAQDITKTKEYQKELLNAKNSAESANALKSRFLANLSHETRTPMNGIIGFLDLLSKTGLTEEQKSYVDKIGESSESLLKLIHDVVDIAKIETNKMTLENLKFSIYDLWKEIQSFYSNKTQAKKLLFNAWIAPNLPEFLIGDSIRIKQILDNLVSNAIKFTQEGTITLKAYSIEKKQDTIKLKFEVVDTGIGILKEDQEKLFQTFSQVDVSSKRIFGGSGLGLVISQQLIKMMGGEIHIESTFNSGSNFYFTIPLQIALPASDKIKNWNPEIYAKTKKENPKILIVEDDEMNREIVLTMLESKGYKCDVAVNGLDAYTMCCNTNYDIILMDCQMPVMDGYESTIKIRSISHNSSCIIAITANAMDGDKEKCLQAGMDDYLSKPINSNLLYKILDKYL